MRLTNLRLFFGSIGLAVVVGVVASSLPDSPREAAPRLGDTLAQFSKFYGTPNRHEKRWHDVATDDYEFIFAADRWMVEVGFVNERAVVLSYDFCTGLGETEAQIQVRGVVSNYFQSVPIDPASPRAVEVAIRRHAELAERFLSSYGAWQQVGFPIQGALISKWAQSDGATALAFGDCAVDIKSAQFNALERAAFLDRERE
jgi:hypothetical protein